jgi:glycosyltransferase involved in cell wall biosynthesis
MLDRVRQTLIAQAKRPPLRWLARPTYEASVRIELELMQRRDAGRVPVACDLDDVTAVVKTFERPRILARLLASMQRVYPTLSVLVVDDGKEPVDVSHPRGRVMRLPYDVGLSAGRNAALEALETPYFVLLDDDFVLTADCGLERVVETMRGCNDLDIVGGQVLTLPTFRKDVGAGNRTAFGGLEGRPSSVGGLPIYDRVANFFVARTTRVASVGWDPKLKLLEHTDFFRRAHGKLLTAFDDRFTCLHAMTPFDDAYMRHRSDVARYQAYLAMKWSRAPPRHRA